MDFCDYQRIQELIWKITRERISPVGSISLGDFGNRFGQPGIRDRLTAPPAF
jgi:hypothetical protein